MIYEKNRRRSGHTEIHRNIRIGDNLLIVKVALDLTGLNSPAERERGRLLIGSDLYGSLGKHIFHRFEIVCGEVISAEDQRIAYTIIIVVPNLSRIGFAVCLLLISRIIVSEPKSGSHGC